VKEVFNRSSAGRILTALDPDVSRIVLDLALFGWKSFFMKTGETLTRSKTTHQSRIREKAQTADRTKSGQITLTKTALANLLESVLYPNPEDPGDPNNPFGPYGPGGPIMQRWMWAALNPQPLPPGPDPYAWVALNPQPLPPGPDPYRSAFAARVVIDRAAAQHQFAEVLGEQQSERSIIIVSGKVRDIVDEWCGTPTPGHHGPRPYGVALLAAGAQFQKAADTMRDNPLQSVFASVAEQLFKTGLSRLQREE
jgi:hypothetical protein